MKRPHNQLVILLMSLAGAVLLAWIGVPPAFAAEDGITCNIQSGPCLKETSEGMTVEFDIQPKPVVALSELTFIVNLTQSETPVTDASVVLDLSMPGMFMGKNRPTLKYARNGRYEGKWIITRCPSGNSTWKAEITVKQASKTTVVDYVFEVR